MMKSQWIGNQEGTASVLKFICFPGRIEQDVSVSEVVNTVIQQWIEREQTNKDVYIEKCPLCY